MPAKKQPATRKPPAFKMPKTLAECADVLYQLRIDRLAQQKLVEVIAANESKVRERLINELPKSKASGITGKVANARIEIKDIPQITDKLAFHKYLKRTGKFELLQNRLSEAAVIEMWEDKKTIPGIGVFKAPKVSCTKK